MVIAIFGENCTGKSAIAEALEKRLPVEVFSGKDYLRFDKNDAQAKIKFKQYLAENTAGGNHVLYVISEREQMALLPERCICVLVTAELDVIKTRFAKRTGGRLPAPVAAILERKHGMFDREPHDVHIVSGRQSVDSACDEILALIRS